LLSGTTSTPMAPTAPSTERAVGVPLDFGLTDPLLPARSELTAKLEALVDAYYQIQPGDKPIDRYTRVSRLHWAGQKIVPASVLAKLYVGIPTTGDLGNMFLPPYNASMQHAKLTTPLAIVTVTGTQANVKMPITFDIVRSNHTVLTSYALPQVAWPASDWAYDHGHWRLTRFAP
jgi:hypothetical protein